MRIAKLVTVVCVLALPLGACLSMDLSSDPSKGELGQAEFAWDVGALGCLFGCDAEAPMAVGAVANLVVVNDEELPDFTVSSTDASVIEFSQSSPGSSFIQAEAYAPGQAKVILTAQGETLDRLAIDAYDVASIEPTFDDEYVDTYTIMVGGEDQVGLTLRNDAGTELVGVGAVWYDFDGGVSGAEMTLVDALADFIVSMLAGSIDEYVNVEATAVGSGQLVVTAGSGVTLEIPVDIVDESAVTDISLATRSDITDNNSVIIDADVRAGIEPVHAASCLWSVSPTEGPVVIDWDSYETVQVSSSGPATATVTCDLGAESASIQLTFP